MINMSMYIRQSCGRSGVSHIKASKIVLDAALGKVGQSREWSGTLPYTSV